jgi:hypothetical protein
MTMATSGKRKPVGKKASGRAKSGRKKWSHRVTETSDALTLDEGVFSRRDPRGIARSLRASAERSKRRKSDPYRSAMSMLTFYINRAGTRMPATRKRTLENAKKELRKLYGKDGPSDGKEAAKSRTRQGSSRARKKR